MKIYDVLLDLCELLDSKKAENIVICDTSKMSNVVDYSLIATSQNVTHTRALADFIEAEALKFKEITSVTREGFNLTEWVVLDFGDFFIHILTKQAREHYNLEKLYNEGNSIKSYEKIKRDFQKNIKKSTKTSNNKSKVMNKKNN